MHTTAAPALWSRPSATAAVQSSEVQASHAPCAEWLMQRNCSIAPCQLLCAYGALCAVSLAIAVAFAWAGAVPVLAFAGVELLVVGAALLVYARHAVDGDRITLDGHALRVEQSLGSRVRRAEFHAAWTRIEPPSADQALIRVSSQGRSILIGAQVRPERRAALARQIQSALQAERLAASPDSFSHTATKRTR